MNKTTAVEVEAAFLRPAPHPGNRRAESGGKGQRQKAGQPYALVNGQEGSCPTTEWPDSAAGEEIPQPRNEVYHNGPQRQGSKPHAGKGGGHEYRDG